MVVLPLVLNRMLLSVVALGLLAEVSLTDFAIEISLSFFIKGSKLSAANVDPLTVEMLKVFVETLVVDLSMTAGVITLLAVDWGLPTVELSTKLGLGMAKISSLILDVMLPEVADLGLLAAKLSTELGGLELLVVVSLAIGMLLFSFISLEMAAMVALMGASISLDRLSSVSLTALVETLAVGLSTMPDVLSVVDMSPPVVELLVVLVLALLMGLSLELKVLLSWPVNLMVAGAILLSVDELGCLTVELVVLEETVVAVEVVVVRSLVTASLLPVLLLLIVLLAVEVESLGLAVGADSLLVVVLMSSTAAGDPLSDCTLGVSFSFSLSLTGRIIWPGRGISLCKFANFFFPRKCSSAKMAFSTVQSITTKSAIAWMTL